MLLYRSLNIGATLVLVGFLLGSSFTLPTLAMDDDDDVIVLKHIALPDDVLKQIVTYAPSYQDTCSAMQTCTRWYAGIRLARPIPDYATVTIVDFGEGMPSEKVKRIHFKGLDRFFELVPQCPWLEGVSLSGISIPYRNAIFMPEKHQLGETILLLDNGRVSTFSESEYTEILSELKKLELWGHPKIIQTLNNVRYLDMSHCNLNSLDEYPKGHVYKPGSPAGEYLDEKLGSILTVLLRGLSCLPSLTDLNLSYNDFGQNMWDLEPHAFFNSSSSLTKLNWSYNNHKAGCVLSIHSGWLNLKEFNISGCQSLGREGGISIDSFAKRVKLCPALESLILKDIEFSDVDKEALKKLLGDRYKMLKFE